MFTNSSQFLEVFSFVVFNAETSKSQPGHKRILWAALFHASHWALQQTHKIIFLIYKLIPHFRLENKRPPTQK